MATASRHWWLFGDRPKPTAKIKPAASAGSGGNSLHPAAERDLDRALDLVARMLRLIGEVPVLPDQPNLDVLRNTCETWARHILTAASVPGSRPGEGESRAWKATAQFLVERRFSRGVGVRETRAQRAERQARTVGGTH